MSLLDHGPDTVLVYPEVISDDGYGTVIRIPGATPVEVSGRMQPVAATETDLGQSVATVYRLIAREVPGGAWARVVWDGRDWEPVGEPQHRNGSAATRHSTVLLRARVPRPL